MAQCLRTLTALVENVSWALGTQVQLWGLGSYTDVHTDTHTQTHTQPNKSKSLEEIDTEGHLETRLVYPFVFNFPVSKQPKYKYKRSRWHSPFLKYLPVSLWCQDFLFFHLKTQDPVSQLDQLLIRIFSQREIIKSALKP